MRIKLTIKISATINKPFVPKNKTFSLFITLQSYSKQKQNPRKNVT